MAQARLRKTAIPSTTPLGLLSAHPRPTIAEEWPLGLQRLELSQDRRDGLIYIPKGYSLRQPAPLILMLHGAGANGEHGIAPLIDYADDAGLILLAPDSRGRTWDLLEGELGPDVDFIDMALETAFERYLIDPDVVAIEGFSDGASYALALGLANSQLFSRIIAFSPGFMAPPFISRSAKPSEIFVSHGRSDSILPVERCGRKVVESLRNAGYPTLYEEFAGGHTIPTQIAREAIRWLNHP